MRSRKNISLHRKPKKRISDLFSASEERFEDALRCHQLGQLDQAKAIYLKILEKNPNHAEALHLLGLIAHQSGNHLQAVRMISRAILLNPANAIYHYNMGVSLSDMGKKNEAIVSFRHAIERYPRSAEAWYNLANLLKEKGNFKESLECYRKATEAKPGYAAAYFNMGRLLREQKRLGEALDVLNKAVQHRPNHAPSHNSLANTLLELGRFGDAMNSYRKAIDIQPDYAEAWYNMGNAFHQEKHFEDALKCYRQAIAVRPNYADAYNNMGITFGSLNRYSDAISCYRKAIELQPDSAGTYNNLGTVLTDLGRYEESLDCFRKALSINPNYAEAYNNMGNLFRNFTTPADAIAAYRKALEFNPEYVSALNNLGLTLKEFGNSEESAECYAKVLKIIPEEPTAYSSYFYLLQQFCDWKALEQRQTVLERMTREALDKGGKTAETPFENTTRFPDPHYNFQVAQSWSNAMSDVARHSGIRFDFDKRAKKNKLVVGYLSFDLRHHPVGHLVAGLFGCHDRENVRVIAYSYGPDDKSEYRTRIAEGCDIFRDIRQMSTASAAQQIYDDGVDILVDMMGHTGGNRLEICALRPAPIQVTWLGFPGTTGAKFMDYVITDELVSPMSHEAYYSEKFVYMPHTYQVNDRWQKISDKAFSKADQGLPQDAFVFCSFSQSYKIEPLIFDVWMNLLKQMDNSVLWLIDTSETAKKNLRHAAGERGIDAERLIFAPRLSKDEHLARHRLADLVLDTRIYNGHTTTSDALWAGVPVITLQGNHFASRVSASLLKAIDLPELITYSLKEYERLALRIARNSDELAAIRKKLENHRLTTPLFDTPKFAKNLEQAYIRMMQRFYAGQVPEHFRIET